MVAQQLGLLPDEPAPPEPAVVAPVGTRRASTVASIFAAGPQPADLESPASF